MGKQSDNAAKSVSKKFYSDIRKRISDAVVGTGGTEQDVAEMTAAVDMYLADGTVTACDAGLSLRLVFAVLQPEIDKAVERSRRARERARRSRRGKGRAKKTVTEAIDAAINKVMAPSESPRIPTVSEYEGIMTETMRDMTGDDSISYRMTRRERRELERERRREERRKLKRKSLNPSR